MQRRKPSFTMSIEELRALQLTPAPQEKEPEPSNSFWKSPEKKSPNAPAKAKKSGVGTFLMAAVVAVAVVGAYTLLTPDDEATVVEKVTKMSFLRESGSFGLVGVGPRYRPDAPLYPLSVFAVGMYVDTKAYCADKTIADVVPYKGPLSIADPEDDETALRAVLGSSGNKQLVLKLWRDVPLAQVVEALVGATVDSALVPVQKKLQTLTDDDFKTGTVVTITWQLGWASASLAIDVDGTQFSSGGNAARALFERLLLDPKTSSTRLKRSVRMMTVTLCGWE